MLSEPLFFLDNVLIYFLNFRHELDANGDLLLERKSLDVEDVEW